MSDSDKRRWYQFSLLSLLSASVAAAVLMFVAPWNGEGRMPGFNRAMNQLSVIVAGILGLVITEILHRAWARKR